MGDGFGTYIKIDNTIIKEKSIINIGNSYLVFSYDIYLNEENKNVRKKLLFLKIYNENNIYDPMILGKDKDYYTIGRSRNNDIIINDMLLSNINCFIYFNSGHWMIQDGNENGKKSTNGTWLYAYENNEIYDKMIFKSNKYNFICKFSSEI